MRLATQGTRTARPAVPRTISRAAQGPQLQSCEGARPLRAPRLPPRLFRARSLCAGSVEGPGAQLEHLRLLCPAPVPHHCVGLPSARWGVGEEREGTRWTRWENGAVRASGVAVKGTHTGRQAFLQGTSAHSRGSFSCSWFIRDPNSPPPLARGSLADGGEGGAPNLRHSGPALCCLNPSPPRSLALPAPSPVSALSHGPPGSC